MSIVPADGQMQRPEREVIVGGPLCESGDIFTQEEGGYVAPRRLPEAAVGDLLVIECAGAYGAVMGSNYNSRPLAAEVLIEEGQPRLIRRRQTFEEPGPRSRAPGKRSPDTTRTATKGMAWRIPRRRRRAQRRKGTEEKRGKV